MQLPPSDELVLVSGIHPMAIGVPCRRSLWTQIGHLADRLTRTLTTPGSGASQPSLSIKRLRRNL